MKNILLATAAAAALLFAPVMASAQYAPQPTAPITTPAPTPSQSATSDNAMDAQPSVTETAPAAPTTVTGQSSVAAAPSSTAQNSTYTAQTAQAPAYATPATPSASAHTQTYGAAATAQSSTHMDAQAPDASVTAQSSAAPSATYGSSSYGATAQPAVASNTQVRGQLISDAKALELAHDAGMQAVPMSAGAVCQPRELDLTGGATHDNRNALEFAVDRASVCELQEIQLPSRGASTFRQALIRQGVDESKIVNGDSGSNEARMTFAGVATSGGQYAAIFNPTRTAANTTTQSMSYAPAQSPSASTTAPTYSYAPSSSSAAPTYAAPAATSDAPSAATPDHSSEHSMDDMSQPSEAEPASPTL